MDKIKEIISKAMISEVKTSPKPGLVDLYDNGAHTDMNYTTFEKSTEAITPYIYNMYEIGLLDDLSLEEKFLKIRKIGLLAEIEMFKATNNVNTHKGMIFSLGIIACCAGVSLKTNKKFDIEYILKIVKEMTFDIIESDFLKIDINNPKTNGEKLYLKYNDKGIRGEVQNGFPNIKNFSLLEMKKLYKECNDENSINLQTLLYLMSNVRDTNVLSRGSEEDLIFIMSKAKRLYNQKSPFTSEGINDIKKFNEECKQRNISPGGCADLLAVTIFLVNLERLNDEL